MSTTAPVRPANAQPAPAKTAPAPAPKPAARMTLANVKRGKEERPVRVVLYGEAGIGKTTFGAEAPDPIFIGAEDGTSRLDVARFPSPERWEDVLEAVRVLEREPHDYRTVVFDTLDWMEPLLWDFICKRDNMANIEAYGFQKGQKSVAPPEWRVFLAAVERVYSRRNMNVIMLAHSWVKTFKNPEGPDYDRWQMMLDPIAAALVRQWADAALFARFESYANKENKNARAKGVSTEKRLIHTVQTAAYDAKNRYGLPETMPLDWLSFIEAVKANEPADPAELVAEITRKAPALPEKLQATVTAKLAEAGTDAEKLAKLNNWVNAKLPEPQQPAAPTQS